MFRTPLPNQPHPTLTPTTQPSKCSNPSPTPTPNLQPQPQPPTPHRAPPQGLMNAVSGDKAPDKSQGPLKGALADLGYSPEQVFKF